MLYRSNIGLDVSARSIAAAAIDVETGEVAQCKLRCDADAVAAWIGSTPQPARCVYEAGPTGYHLQRQLAARGINCCIAAPGKMLRPSGDRVKTDRRDAVYLARSLAVGNIVEVAVPTEELEAARELARECRRCRDSLASQRKLVDSILLRKGMVYDGRKWSRAHRAWLESIRFRDHCDQLVLDDALQGIESLDARIDRLEEAISERAAQPDLGPTVAALECLRGISTHTAYTIAVEVGDFSRFPHRHSLAAYIGLVPSEFSSGRTLSRGETTRTGNKHVRGLLVLAAQKHACDYNPPPVDVVARNAGVPDVVAAAAVEANVRLHERYMHLARDKPRKVVNFAIARELAAAIWEVAILLP